MQVFKKVRTILHLIKHYIWFLNKISYYPHLTYSILNYFKKRKDSIKIRELATMWAKNNCCYDNQKESLKFLSLNYVNFSLNEELLKKAEKNKSYSKTLMGGGGDINLLYSLAKNIDAQVVIETGVAYGFSSLAFLQHFMEKEEGNLISVDMPYPWRGNESDVGIVVDKKFYNYWNLIRLPDRNGLKLAIKKIGDKKIDIFHYDSDKSYHGRMYAYNLVWPHIREGGFFISDDIQDNFAFKDFVENNAIDFFIKKFNNKFIGIINKK